MQSICKQVADASYPTRIWPSFSTFSWGNTDHSFAKVSAVTLDISQLVSLIRMVVAVRHLFISGELAPCRKQAINTCPADFVVTWTFAGWQPIIFYVTGIFTEIMLLDLGCLLNGLFWWRSKRTPKFHATSLCEGNPPVTDIFPSQRASNVSIWWRHHVVQALRTRQDSQDENITREQFPHC